MQLEDSADEVCLVLTPAAAVTLQTSPDSLLPCSKNVYNVK